MLPDNISGEDISGKHYVCLDDLTPDDLQLVEGLTTNGLYVAYVMLTNYIRYPLDSQVLEERDKWTGYSKHLFSTNDRVYIDECGRIITPKYFLLHGTAKCITNTYHRGRKAFARILEIWIPKATTNKHEKFLLDLVLEFLNKYENVKHSEFLLKREEIDYSKLRIRETLFELANYSKSSVSKSLLD